MQVTIAQSDERNTERLIKGEGITSIMEMCALVMRESYMSFAAEERCYHEH
jgi:hypothetical protein